ncbi:MAG: phosphopyruvate hydratase [Methanobacteriota archaeon]|nr:MAG: phosphopyruvate hydratase [Euryarchaeota archaeon]
MVAGERELVIIVGAANIVDVKARWILDSRGKPTIYCEVSDGKNVGIGRAPSGASTGKKEALELRDKGKDFHGFGVSNAVDNINTIVKDAIVGMVVDDITSIDKAMEEIDGSENFSKIGGNASVAVSMACASCAAKSNGEEVYEFIERRFSQNAEMPKAMFNIINGGKHAGNRLSVQEFLIVPQYKRVEDNIKAASEVYWELKEIIKKRYGKEATNVGDEGGFAPPLVESGEALTLIEEAVGESGHSGKVRKSIDAAADSFYNNGIYNIDGKEVEGGELVDYYVALAKEYSLLSIEDPFVGDSLENFIELKKKDVSKIIGDDITVTNGKLVEMNKEGINGIIVKPNQVGTVSKAVEAVETARKVGATFTIGSHRSGETEDTFIADFSVGMGLPYVKFGAPARGERTAKYNRLLDIEWKWKQ